jgi:branched-chain amino acid transport system substrate-binding protein
VKRRKWVATAAVVAVSGAFAVVGGVPAEIAGAQSGPARGVTSTSINVAGLSQQSQFSADELKTGATARFNVENTKGGVFGRKINYVESANDQGDVSTDLSQVQRLVQQAQVFAIVPSMTPYLDEAGPFLAQQHVPFFGWGIDHVFCKNPYAFGFTGCIVPPPNIPTTGTTWGALVSAYLKTLGNPNGAQGKTAAVISEDNATGKTGATVIEAQVKKAGFKAVYVESTLPAVPPGDYSPFVNKMITSAGGKAPDAIFLTTSVPNTLGLATALPAAGYKGVLSNAVLYDPRSSGFKNNTFFTQFDVPVDTNSAAMQQIVANIKAVGGPNVVITQGMLSSYFSADSFIAVLKKVGKNLTPETMAKAMANFTYQIPGVIGPTKYPAAQTQGSPCGVLTAADGTKLSVVVPYLCGQDFNYKTGKALKY